VPTVAVMINTTARDEIQIWAL